MICPRCSENSCVQINRQPSERFEEKNGQKWCIEFCTYCQYNFDITAWPPPDPPIVREDGLKKLIEEEERRKAEAETRAKTKRKGSWLKPLIRPDPDEDSR